MSNRQLWIFGKHTNQTQAELPRTDDVLTLKSNNHAWAHYYQRSLQNPTLADELIGGQEYTLSFEARSNTTTANYIRFFLRQHFTGGSNNTARYFTVSKINEWQRFTTTFTLQAKHINHTQWQVMFEINHATAGQFEFRRVKLEKGNVATDWTPAPEDTQSQLDQKASTATLDEFKQAQATKEQATAQRIAALDAAYKLADTTLTARLAREETARASANAALTQRLDSLQSTVNGNKASIDAQLRTLSEKDKAQAQQLSQLGANLGQKADAAALNNLTTKVNQVEGRITAEASKYSTLQTTVGQHTASIRNVEQSVNGVKAIKAVTVDNNGFISGYGLMSELQNGRVTSSFGINADQIYFGATKTAKKPFIFATRPTTIDGVSYPAGAWFNSVHIANGSIDIAKINKASIQSLSALSANIGHFKSAQTGARLEIKDSVLLVYDANNVLRVRLGLW